jgi:hypothetical protein
VISIVLPGGSTKAKTQSNKKKEQEEAKKD